jgi:hypothetical protein
VLGQLIGLPRLIVATWPNCLGIGVKATSTARLLRRRSESVHFTAKALRGLDEPKLIVSMLSRMEAIISVTPPPFMARMNRTEVVLYQ